MAYRWNPFTNNLDFTPDISALVPYTGATANVDLGSFLLLAAQVRTDNISDYGNTGGGIGMQTGVIKDQFGEISLDWKLRKLSDLNSAVTLDYGNRQSFYPDGVTVSHDWGLGKLHESTLGNVTIDYHNRTLLFGGVAIVDWQTGYFSDTFGGWAIKLDSRHLMDTTGNYATVDWGVQVLNDGGGVKAVEWTTTQRWLFDFTGSYPTVDFGNYWLFNIPLTNNGPLIDWSPTAGGVRIYSYYSGGYHNSGDFVGYILNNPAGPTLDWANRYLIDTSSLISADWGGRQLYPTDQSYPSIDWQNRLLYSTAFGGVIAIDYGQHFLNNGGGFLSIDFTSHITYDQSGATASIKYHDRQLIAADGSTVFLDWSGAFNSGAIVFANSSGTLSQDVGGLFVWDETTTRLGVGTSTPTAAIDVEGDFKLGVGGSIFQTMLAATATLDFPSTSTYADLTVTVTGAVVGDVVSVGVPDACMFSHTTYFAWVSAADTVTIRFLVVSGGPHDPPSDDFKVVVTRF